MVDIKDNQDESTALIDFILAHKKEYAQSFLKSNGFHYSGTKETLRERLKDLVVREEITQESLVSLLDQIELFGNQHAYLFKITDPHLGRLRDPNHVRTLCESQGLGELYNNYKPLILPENPEIASIYHDYDWLRIRWVTKKETLQLMEEKREKDEEGREFLIKKYLIRKLRATTLFRVSLITGDADLLIHRLPSGSSYRREKNVYLEQLDDWFGWGVLDHEDLFPTISRIEASGEARIRNVDIRTARGSHIDIVSPSVHMGIRDDPDAASARSSITTGVGNRGNFYWLPQFSGGFLLRNIHTIIYRDRVALFGECEEEEVNYVLGRVRSFI